MLLNDRKLKILQAIINDYIETAEPIGSRTIAKKCGLGISSATIRNEMNDLEELGLINRLHNSSGRVPGEKGYRYYVDRMMQHTALTPEVALAIQRMIIASISRTEFMIQETAKVLSRLTNYPAVVSEPFLKKTKIKHVQLVPLDEKSILIVLVTDRKNVKNQVIKLPNAPDYAVLTRLTQLLNARISELSVRDISRKIIDSLHADFGPYAFVLMPVLGKIAEMLGAGDDVRVYASGVKNILAFPEFSDIRKAEAIFQALEDREFLVALLGEDAYEGIQILIGAENTQELLKACSLIKANYTIDNQSTGCIAIIGPMRMDYSQAVSVMEGILQNLQHVVQALELHDKN